jgi:uncharacterized protein YidB (DUF937 family)
MDLNDIVNLGASAFKGKLDLNGDGKVDLTEATTAIKTLLSNEKGEIDLAAIVDKMKSSGFGEIAQTWLSDGKNSIITPGQVSEIFGKDKIAAFAEKLGIRNITALNGIADALPKLVDKASPTGSLADSLIAKGQELLESVGGVDGIVEKATPALVLEDDNQDPPPAAPATPAA